MNKFELNPTIQEIINIKYAEVLLMDKLYKEELIITKEHELLISQCEKELKKKIKGWEVLNGRKIKIDKETHELIKNLYKIKI